MSINAANDWSDDQEEGEVIDFERLFGAVRRQWRVVILCALLATVLGAVYVLTAVPRYTANASVMIDRSNSKVLEQLSSIGAAVDDEGSILSQVELLKSETIGLSVIDKLKLTENPEFMAADGSLTSVVRGYVRAIMALPKWFSGPEPETAADVEDQRRVALGKLIDNIEVARMGRTYVLNISYMSTSPDLSVRIANGIAEAYLTDTLDSKYEATRRASGWLQDRIAELQQKALESDLAVQKFRVANGLLAVGDELVSDQKLSEINSALVVAQADTAKARARYEQIQQILAAGDSDAIVTDVLDSSISNDLRRKYLDASKRATEISARLGPNHGQAVRLRAEMSEYKRLMLDELTRISESYRSDVDVAVARERSLLDSVALATGVTATANETQVQLRELERESETYRNLYQTFLQRYQEAIQQQSFPITEARIISRAVPPSGPASPKRSIALALAFMVGGALGVGVGALREFQERFFRTGDQIRDELGLEFLGIAPLSNPNRPVFDNGLMETRPANFVRKRDPISNLSIDHPLSAFAETLRSAKIAVDLSVPSKSCKVIGVVSALPGEGKSTVSVNFAELLANQGARVVLIDADLRNPGATRAMAQHATSGLIECLIENVPLADVMMTNPVTKLGFVPVVIKGRLPYSSEMLTSHAMTAILTQLSETNDYIILDLPPVGAVVDARALAPSIDSFLFVTEWGKTARRVVRHILDTEPQITSKCAGVILNKVDQRKMKLYQIYGSSEYYSTQYSAYRTKDV